MILGLSIPKFLGAILVGLILSGVLITLLIPHDEIQKPVVTPVKQTSMDMDMSGMVSQIVYLTIIAIIGGVMISILSSLVTDNGRY